MTDKLAKESRRQDRTIVWVLFLTNACLALLVKISRLDEEGMLTNSAVWNSLPSYCFVFGLSLLGMLFKPQFERKQYRKFCISVAAGAILYEVEQIWLAGRSFDPFDLLAIVLGSLSAWFIYWRINLTEESFDELV